MTTLSFPDGALFKRAVRAVTPAASTDLSRPMLTNVQFDFKDGSLRMSATDGYRLNSVAFKHGAVEVLPGGVTPFLVNATWLRRLLPLVDGKSPVDVKASAGAAGMSIYSAGFSFVAPQLAGDFPKVDPLVSPQHELLDESKPDAEMPAFNMTFLEELAKSVRAWTPRFQATHAKVRGLSKLKPFQVEVTNAHGTLTVLTMPVRL